MEPDKAQEISERDQLWASLRALKPEFDCIAAGELDGSLRQQEMFKLLACIVSSEIDFRLRHSAT